MASLSRQLAQWTAALRYEDIPAAVVDRAKGVTLQALTSVLIGAKTNPGKQAIKMIADEETGVKKGATIMTDGTLVTKDVPTAVSGGILFSAVTTGGWHSCGLEPNGKAWCWGSNDQGELGTGLQFQGQGRTPVAVRAP